VPELIHAIEEYLAASNADLKPLVWKASAKAILDKLARCKVVYETLDWLSHKSGMTYSSPNLLRVSGSGFPVLRSQPMSL
jgi:hypothetical protein